MPGEENKDPKSDTKEFRVVVKQTTLVFYDVAAPSPEVAQEMIIIGGDVDIMPTHKKVLERAPLYTRAVPKKTE